MLSTLISTKLTKSTRKNVEEYIKHICGISQKLTTGSDLSEDVSRLEFLKEEFEKWKDVQEARKILIEYATLHLGISCVHPNMDPHTWKPPYGNVSMQKNVYIF